VTSNWSNAEDRRSGLFRHAAASLKTSPPGGKECGPE
jgi:hypothetical protein